MRTNDLSKSSDDAIIAEGCQLGLLVFLAEMRRRCGIHPTRTAVLTEKASCTPA
jgi:hypothetical protein